jgi:hypothetical protein
MITIVCVHKKGVKFNVKYVDILYTQLKNNITKPFEFVCLTDDAETKNREYKTIDLIHGLEGWWSKLELFRDIYNTEYVLYFDLDSLILRNIDLLLEEIKKHNFLMLKDFFIRQNMYYPISGIMAWKTTSRFPKYIYESFMKCPKENIAITKTSKIRAGQEGDQGYLKNLLGMDNIELFQDYLPENYIWGKIHTQDLPNKPNCNIVAWSGKPELDKIYKKYSWINEVWGA